MPPVLLLVLAYAGFISLGLPDGLLGVGWPHMRLDIDQPLSAIGYVLFCTTAGYLLSGAATGFLTARVGIGWLLAASTGVTAAALAGYAVAPALAVMVVAGWFLGFGSGAIDAGLNAYAARHFNARHMNWMHACYGAGAMLGPLAMTGVVAVGATWRWGYGGVALGQAVLAVAFLATVHRWAAGHRSGDAPVPAPAEPVVAPAAAVETAGVTAPAGTAAGGTGPGPAGPGSVGLAGGGVATSADPPTGASPDTGTDPPRSSHGRDGAGPVRRTLALPAVWRGAAAFGVYVGLEVGTGLWAYTVLTAGHGLASAVAGPAVSAYYGFLFVGRLVFGLVTERLGTGRVLGLATAGLATGASLLALPVPGAVAVTGLVLLGFAAAPVFPLMMLTTADRVGAAHADRTIGVQVACAGLGGAALPAGIGVLADRFGVGVVGPVLVLLAALLAVLCLARRRTAVGR